MLCRKILVAIMVLVTVSPAWGGGEPLGSVVSSNEATVRDSALQARAPPFSSATSFPSRRAAGAQIAINGGGQAEVLSNSAVRLTKDGDKVQIVVDRGQASFRSSGATGMTALVGDVSVRPASGAETAAVIQSLSETHAVIAAQKGRATDHHAERWQGLYHRRRNGSGPFRRGRSAAGWSTGTSGKSTSATEY